MKYCDIIELSIKRNFAQRPQYIWIVLHASVKELWIFSKVHAMVNFNNRYQFGGSESMFITDRSKKTKERKSQTL